MNGPSRALPRLPLFATLGMAALLALGAVSRSAAFAHGGPLPFAVFFDLMITLPVVFAVFVLRPAKRPLLDAAPVLALGALAARVLLGARPETKPLLLVGGAMTEAVVLTVLVRRVRGAARQLHEADGDDVLLRVAALTDPVLRFLGAELLVFYYAFVGPRVRRPLRAGEFSYHEKSGVGGVLLALGFVTLMEGISLHFLIHAWSPRASWVFAAVNVYALVWFVAAFHAARLRPVAVSSARLFIRTSVLWSIEIPRAAIAGVAPIHDWYEVRRQGRMLRAAVGAAPNVLVTLTTPVVARGLLGISRTASCVALYVDDPEGLRAALSA